MQSAEQVRLFPFTSFRALAVTIFDGLPFSGIRIRIGRTEAPDQRENADPGRLTSKSRFFACQNGYKGEGLKVNAIEAARVLSML